MNPGGVSGCGARPAAHTHASPPAQIAIQHAMRTTAFFPVLCEFALKVGSLFLPPGGRLASQHLPLRVGCITAVTGAPAGAFGDGAVLPAEAAPASYGGNVGPVGSEQERAQLTAVTGQPVTAATQLLLGPVVRGMTVAPAASEPGEQPR